MTEALIGLLAFLITVVLMPPFVVGIVRKTKARLQNRVGAPIMQLFFDLLRLMRKSETVSDITSWLFRSSSALELSLMLVIAGTVPWLSFVPHFCSSDLFLIIYLLAIVRVITVLFALDSGSPFGSFGASREVTLALLVEPATVLALVSVAVCAQTSNLSQVFVFEPGHAIPSVLWCLVGVALLLSAVVDLSRMPIDDPSTHLELTMVHEAMIIEASGRVLALKEMAHALRLTVLLGLTAQCFLHAVPFAWLTSALVRGMSSLVLIVLLAAGLGVFESVSVKLGWRKTPEFIAYALTMSLFACFFAIGHGAKL